MQNENLAWRCLSPKPVTKKKKRQHTLIVKHRGLSRCKTSWIKSSNSSEKCLAKERREKRGGGSVTEQAHREKSNLSLLIFVLSLFLHQYLAKTVLHEHCTL